MGLRRVAKLHVERMKHSVDECGLWAGRDMDLRVFIGDKQIALPVEVILAQVVRFYRDEKVSRYENMSDGEVLSEMMGVSDVDLQNGLLKHVIEGMSDE